MSFRELKRWAVHACIDCGFERKVREWDFGTEIQGVRTPDWQGPKRCPACAKIARAEQLFQQACKLRRDAFRLHSKRKTPLKIMSRVLDNELGSALQALSEKAADSQ